MNTKKIIASLMAITMLGSMLVGCGADTDSKTSTESTTSVTDVTTESTDTATTSETTTETTAETSTATSTDVAAGTESVGDVKLPENIRVANKSSFTAKNVGNYETYLDGFTLPKNMAMIASAAGNSMTIATVDDTVMLDMDISATNEETGETQKMQFSMYTDGKTMWAITSEGDQRIAQKAEIKTDEDNALGSMSDDSDISDAKFTFKEYLGEETVSGQTYDVISCTTEEAGLEDAKLYVDKEGNFSMMSVVKDGSATILHEIQSIDIPNETWEDTTAEELGTTMFGAILAFAFSGMEDLDSGIDTPAESSEAAIESSAVETMDD